MVSNFVKVTKTLDISKQVEMTFGLKPENKDRTKRHAPNEVIKLTFYP